MAHTAPRPEARRAGRPPMLAAPRERILEEAAKLFAHSGYDGSSVADLAAALGVSKAAIYHYFTTKQDIYDAIILAVLEGLTRHVGQALTRRRARPSGCAPSCWAMHAISNGTTPNSSPC